MIASKIHKRVRDATLGLSWWWTLCPRWKGDIHGIPPPTLRASDRWAQVDCARCLKLGGKR
jgi:hypothetical protein